MPGEDNFDEILDQVERTALHQLVLLDTMAQAMRPRLTDALPPEEAIAVSHALLATSHELRQWIGVLLPARTPEDDAPVSFQPGEEESG